MIGQERFKETIQEFIDNNHFPLFSIIVGKTGIGKKTACKEIAKRLNCQYVIWGNKIDEIRELKQIMENQDKEIVYCIPDYEDMSQGARNSILKICEEPPRNAHIVLTSYSKDVIIPTILGRGTVFELDGYTKEEIYKIAEEVFEFKDSELLENVVDLCDVPGELEIVKNINVKEFIEFMNILWNNIGKASAGNLLKITNKIKLKEDSQGYDINIFINYLTKLNNNSPVSDKKLKIFYEILEARKNIQLKYNKQYILDNLLLNIRGVLNGVI